MIEVGLVDCDSLVKASNWLIHSRKISQENKQEVIDYLKSGLDELEYNARRNICKKN